MVNQIDIVKPESLEVWDNHGNTEDEFEEYSEEEFLSEEESNENLSMSPKKKGSCAKEPKEDRVANKESAEEVSCGDESDHEESCPDGDESDHEESCPEEPSEEDPDEESETASAEYQTLRTTLDEASDEDPSNVSYEEIIEEEFYEESEEESMDQQLPLVTDSDGVPKATDHILLESKTSAKSSCNKCLSESTNFSTDAIDPLASRKERRSRWDIKAEAPMLVNDSVDRDKRKSRWSNDTKSESPILVNNSAGLKRRKTRWSSDETQSNMSCSPKLSDSVKGILSDSYNDQNIQKLNAKLQEINQKLDASMLLIKEPQEESSPSPQSIDVSLDSSIDARKFNIRLMLVKEKLKIISELTKNKQKDDHKCRPKHSYTFCKKLYIPVKEYPNYNFMGLILGPHGNTLKKMEEETGAIILLRGKGSNFKEKKTYASEDDQHVLIQASSQISLDSAVSMVEKLLVPVDDLHNYHKAAQLRELAELRGTLNEGSVWATKPCDICGKSSHPTADCPLTATTSKTNANFLTGTGSLFSSFKTPSLSPSPLPFVAKAYDHKPKECDPANLFVGFLPQSVCTDKLKELFLPYGSICEVHVIMDKITSRSKGYGFVKYTNASDASKATENMNGYTIEGKKLAVRIAGTFPTLNANLPIYPGSVSIPTPPSFANLPNFPIPLQSSNLNLPNYPSNANLPNYPKLAAIPPEIPRPDCWPGPPGSMLPESSTSFPKSSYNLSTYTETVPLRSSASLDSTFRTTSLGKDEYMMDFAVTPREIHELNCWPCPTSSILPESDTYFPKRNYNLLNYTGSVAFRSSTYLGSPSQTSISSSQFSGVTATSNELASFPGYLKSFDPPGELDQSMPSSSLSSRAPYFVGKSSGNQMNPTWP